MWQKIFAVIFVIISIMYPFALYFIGRKISVIMALCWGIKAIIDKKNKMLSFTICLIFIIISASSIFSDTTISNLAFFYPTIINIILLGFFAISLKGEAFITKIAKTQNPNLDSKGIAYTRNLTKIWCCFFVCNAIIATILAILEDKIYWSVFCGIISYILMGMLFCLEWLYRKLILKH